MEHLIIQEVVTLPVAVDGDNSIKHSAAPIIGLVKRDIWDIVNKLQSLALTANDRNDTLLMSRLFHNIDNELVRDEIRSNGGSWGELVDMVESGLVTNIVYEFDVFVPTEEGTHSVRACFLIGLGQKWSVIAPPKYSILMHGGIVPKPNAEDARSFAIPDSKNPEHSSFEDGV